MDWRQMAGRPTTGSLGTGPWETLRSVWSGGKQVGSEEWNASHWNGQIDSRRGWIVAACWIAASGAECVPQLCYTNIYPNRLLASSISTRLYEDPGSFLTSL